MKQHKSKNSYWNTHPVDLKLLLKEDNTLSLKKERNSEMLKRKRQKRKKP